MSQVHVLNHPLIQHKLTIMRKKETGPKEFRELLEEISTLMVYEVTRDLPTEEVEIETPICKMKSKVLAGKKLGIVPILRAGLGMVDGVTNLIPACRVGHIGLYRDPVTLNPVEYYCKLPADAQERELIVLDPMLATGNSAIAAVSLFLKRGIALENLTFVSIVSAPEGLMALTSEFPELRIVTATIDEGLNARGYILPGLGDAGDRLFNTFEK